ncbi:hypothetical protein PV703_11325 [Streptomyces sp. ME01-24h]|nr:hypothetical protein [Streptomyces sp. ME01-24h]
MTITFVGVGASSSNAATITPAYPASPAAGQLAVLQVVSATSTEATPSTPTGWTLAASLSGGSGSFGTGTGPRRLTWFTRVLLGGDATPTTTVPPATGSAIAGRILMLSRSAGTGWRWAATTGTDTTSGTGFSAPGADALTWAAGDFAILGYGVPVSTASMTAEAVTATGITFGTVTERADDQITTGNAARYVMATGSVTAGSGSQIPTVASTAAAATTGVAGVLRIREAASAITATPQSVFPPRNLISATGLLADDIVTATLYRQDGASRTPVRAAADVDVTGQNALLRIDAEQPFGVPVTYTAELTDINGNVWTASSSPITSTVTSDVISDAVQGIGAAVTIESWPNKKRDRDATVFNVGGRIVVVGRARSAAAATVRVRTDSKDAGDALQAVLDGATEGVVQIRKQSTMAGVDNYLAVLTDTEDRTWYNDIRWWGLDVYETEPWPDVLEAAGYTLQDIADNFSTLGDLAAFFTPGTLLSIALHDFGV